MRKSWRSLVTKRFKYWGFSLSGLAAVLAVNTCVVRVQAAETDPNQLIAFKRIYVEPIQDNIDGAFKEPVLQSYKDVFERNPRFELANEAQSADSILRSSIKKKATGIDVELSLLLAATGEIYSTEKTTIAPDKSGRETGEAIKGLLKTVLKRIPFYGTVTGRDASNLTFDIGAAHGLQKGDVIQISRIDNIKRHPLLKSIVDMQLVPVGNASVDSVEDMISFGHVQSEIPGERIQRLSKITAIEARAVLETDKKPRQTDAHGVSQIEEIEEDSDRPQIGFLSIGGLLSGFSSTSARNNGAESFSGSAFNPGFRLGTEIWLTKHWFADLQIGYTGMSFTQKDDNSTAEVTTEGQGGNTKQFGINGGYRILPTDSIYGPQAFLKLGYYSFSWDIPARPSVLQGSKSYSAINLGIGGVLPIGNHQKGLNANVNILLFPSLSEEGFNTGGSPSGSGAGFYIGGYYYLSPSISLRGGILFEFYSGDFEDGRSSTNQKVIGFLPSIQYYF